MAWSKPSRSFTVNNAETVFFLYKEEGCFV